MYRTPGGGALFFGTYKIRPCLFPPVLGVYGYWRFVSFGRGCTSNRNMCLSRTCTSIRGGVIHLGGSAKGPVCKKKGSTYWVRTLPPPSMLGPYAFHTGLLAAGGVAGVRPQEVHQDRRTAGPPPTLRGPPARGTPASMDKNEWGPGEWSASFNVVECIQIYDGGNRHSLEMI